MFRDSSPLKPTTHVSPRDLVEQQCQEGHAWSCEPGGAADLHQLLTEDRRDSRGQMAVIQWQLLLSSPFKRCSLSPLNKNLLSTSSCPCPGIAGRSMRTCRARSNCPRPAALLGKEQILGTGKQQLNALDCSEPLDSRKLR